MATDPKYKVRHARRNVCMVDHTVPGKGWEQWYLLTSDHHWDNPKCQRDILKRHLGEAIEKRAGILIVGDLFCAMQGKYDKRASKDDVRPEHQNDRYLDSLVETAVKWYAPYSQNIIVVGQGNHETSVKKHHETDLTERFVAGLNCETGGNVQAGGYGGWVRFAFRRNGKTKDAINLKYYHGHGGGGPVTRGVINTNRMATYLPDADIICSGHVHESWLVETSRERLSAHGGISRDYQTHVCLGTYKEEYADGFGGFHVEKGRPPKPIGAWWLRFYISGDKVQFSLIQAKG